VLRRAELKGVTVKFFEKAEGRATRIYRQIFLRRLRAELQGVNFNLFLRRLRAELQGVTGKFFRRLRAELQGVTFNFF
jgi:hypothetical protein